MKDLTNAPNGVANKTNAPNKEGHQSFKNLVKVSTLSLFFGSLNQSVNFTKARPSNV